MWVYPTFQTNWRKCPYLHTGYTKCIQYLNFFFLILTPIVYSWACLNWCAVSSSRGILKGKKGHYIWASNMVNIYKRFIFYSDNILIQRLYIITLKSKTNQCLLAKYVQTLKYVHSFVKRTELVTDRSEWLSLQNH